MPIKTFTLTLKSVEDIAPEVRHFAFTLPQDHDFSFIPGQFITMYFDFEGSRLKRSYSIASIQGQTECIEFAAGYVQGGPASQVLFKLKPGDTIEVGGPFGRLILRETDSPSRLLMLATSTGVTPYRAMLPEFSTLLNAKPDLQIQVLQGVRTHQDILYADEFLAFAEQHSNFTFTAHYSREPHDFARQAHEHLGYVQHSFDTLQPNPEHDLVYLCGNPGMIDDGFATLQQLHFPTASVRREKYLSK